MAPKNLLNHKTQQLQTSHKPQKHLAMTTHPIRPMERTRRNEFWCKCELFKAGNTRSEAKEEE
jgi:hypothetical protein